MAKNYLTVEHGLVFGEGENEVEIETDFIAQEILENFYDDWSGEWKLNPSRYSRENAKNMARTFVRRYLEDELNGTQRDLVLTNATIDDIVRDVMERIDDMRFAMQFN